MTRHSDVREMVEAALPLAKQDLHLATAHVLMRDNLNAELMQRYDIGSEEHDHEWLNWGEDLFIKNYKEEVYDMILYTAMNIVRSEMSRRYGGNASTSYNRAKLLSCEESATATDESA